MTDKPDPSENISEHLSKVLSTHGHGFHYAVLERAARLVKEGKSRWTFEADEFPVEVQNEVTHVDFILKRETSHTYLVAECKRADPARAKWCFLAAPWSWLGARGDEVIIQEVNVLSDVRFQPQPRIGNTGRGSYRIGLDLKTGEVGDGVESQRAINKAASQVLRGMNGVVRHLFGSRATAIFTRGRIWFLPAIFTTAELWISKADLREADLKNGKVDPADATRVNWLWFTHNQSPALVHGLSNDTYLRNLSTDLYREFARSIAVVSAEGVDEFLSINIEDFFG